MNNFNQSNLDSELSKHVNHIFANEKIWKLSLKIVFPALLISLLFGIFIFADQIMMQHIAPYDGNKYFQNIQDGMGINWNNALIAFYGSSDIQDFKLNEDLIRVAITYSSVITLVVLSLGLFINTGSSIIYGRAFAESNNLNKQKIISNGFYGSLISGLIFMFLMFAIQTTILGLMLPNPTETALDSINNLFDPELYSELTDPQKVLIENLTKEQLTPILIQFNQLRNNSILNLGNQYIYFLSASIPFVSILNLYMFLLRVEGRNLWITSFSIGANILNIFFDFIFLYFAKLGMIGSGLATLIGYILNLFAVLIYLFMLNKKNQTDIKFWYLKKFDINWKILLISFILGSGTFLRDFSLAIANIFYLPVWSATISATGWASILIDVGGVSATPIYNLFFFAIFGIVDGLRPILTYNYAQKKYERVKQTFYNGVYISLIYAVIVNLIVFLPTYIPKDNNQFLQFLGANNSDGTINPNRQLILYVLMPSMMLQLIFLSFTVSGLGIFQATGKMLLNVVCSIIQGLITFFPILYITSAIALAIKSWQLMIYSGFINIVISSFIIFGISLIYLYKYMGKKEKFNDPNLSIERVTQKIFKINK